MVCKGLSTIRYDCLIASGAAGIEKAATSAVETNRLVRMLQSPAYGVIDVRHGVIESFEGRLVDELESKNKQAIEQALC